MQRVRFQPEIKKIDFEKKISGSTWKKAEQEMFNDVKDLHAYAIQNGWKPREFIEWKDTGETPETEYRNYVDNEVGSVYRQLIDRANNNNAVSMGNSNVKGAAPTVSQSETVKNAENISAPKEELF